MLGSLGTDSQTEREPETTPPLGVVHDWILCKINKIVITDKRKK